MHKNETKKKTPSKEDVSTCSGGRTRTADMVVNSHPLYQLSYAGMERDYEHPHEGWQAFHAAKSAQNRLFAPSKNEPAS